MSGYMDMLVARRRARRDRGLLAATISVVAVSTVLAVVGPSLVLATIDGGARDVVAAAGVRSDVLFSAPVGENSPTATENTPKVSSPQQMVTVAHDLPDRLPKGLAAVYSASSLTVLGHDTAAGAIDGVSLAGVAQLRVRAAMLTSDNATALRLASGRLPNPREINDTTPIETVISSAAAAATGLVQGSVVGLTPPTDPDVGASNGADSRPSAVVIVGIVEPADGESDAAAAVQPIWQDTPDLWTPVHRDASASEMMLNHITVLANPDGISSLSLMLGQTFQATVRLRVDSHAFTSALGTRVMNDIVRAQTNTRLLSGDNGPALAVRTSLLDVLATYPRSARAALAQMSVMMAGAIGIAAIVLILLSRLLVLQRAGILALERARGSSVPSIGLRALLEAAVITAAGTAVGIAVAWVLLGSPPRDALPIVAVAAVSLLSSPLLAMLFVVGLWAGRREPANRRDRAQLARRRGLRRVVVELGVIAITAGALVSLRGRGLLQTRTDGIDPFLAVAPLLLAVAVSIVVMRVYPLPVKLVGTVSRRSRGVLGLLGAVRAEQAIAMLPVMVLTLGTALAVSGGLLVDTVRSGLDEAAWQRVGAQVRFDRPLDSDQLETLAATPGVTAVATSTGWPLANLQLGTTSTIVTLVAIDTSYPNLVDHLPDAPSTESLRSLASAPPDDDRLAVVVDAATARQLISKDISLYYGPDYLPLRVIGTTNYHPDGYLDGPFAFVDLASLAAHSVATVEASTVLITGPQAESAATHLGLPPSEALTRTKWVKDRSGLAIVSGVEQTMIFAILAAALLAAIGLVATTVAGARARGRALSLLRTLGLPGRLGWWLALAELAPLVIAAIVGGIAAGLIVVAALAPSLGLDVLAGGTTVPAPSLSPVVLWRVAIGALVLLAIGALADVMAHRRNKLSEVLRVGDTV